MHGFSTKWKISATDSSGNGVMLFVMKGIPSKLLHEYKSNSSVKTIFIEINLRWKKGLLSCSYNPNFTILTNYIQNISRGIDFYSSKYNNVIVPWDFNT